LRSSSLLLTFSAVTCPSFLFHATPTSETSSLSLHDALPISSTRCPTGLVASAPPCSSCGGRRARTALRVISRPITWRSVRHQRRDRKSTRLNSSHGSISYAVFCLKKKKENNTCVRTEIVLAS